MLIEYFDPFRNPESLRTTSGVDFAVKTLLNEFENGNGKSGYMLALLHSADSEIVPVGIKREFGFSDKSALKWYEQSFPLLLEQAQIGDGEAMYFISTYYQCGLSPVEFSQEKLSYWRLEAKKSGYNEMGSE